MSCVHTVDTCVCCERSEGSPLKACVSSLSLLALAAAPALAQTGTVTGQVTNAAGQPLPGAQVAVEGTTLGGLSIEAGGTAVRDFVLQLTALSMDEIVSAP